jgi:hypothetical protein
VIGDLVKSTLRKKAAEMKIPLVFALAVSGVLVYVVWHSLCAGQRDLLDIGTFIVLALTLITLVKYAYDTNSIARVTRYRWKRESVLNATYEMEVIGAQGGPGRTLFRIHNPSKLVVRAKVRCNFRLYGDRVDDNPAFDGSETWYVFPQQTSQGWFEIDPLLQKKGKTVAQMIAEMTAGNRATQLTMDLQIEFRDELGQSRILPSRSHHFDFADWRWVPVLAQKDDWV